KLEVVLLGAHRVGVAGNENVGGGVGLQLLRKHLQLLLVFGRQVGLVEGEVGDGAGEKPAEGSGVLLLGVGGRGRRRFRLGDDGRWGGRSRLDDRRLVGAAKHTEETDGGEERKQTLSAAHGGVNLRGGNGGWR